VEHVQELGGQEGQREASEPAVSPRGTSAPEPAAQSGFLDAASVLALQRSAGNAAVSAQIPAAAPPQPASTPEAVAPRRAAAEDSAQRELARAVQRRARSQPGVDAGSPAVSLPPPAFGSPALLLRSKLRSEASTGRVTLQRAIRTSGGEWDTDQYELKKDVSGTGTPVAAAAGVRGLDIKLKFKPMDPVDAELIGLTQTAQTFVAAAPQIVPAATSRSIPAGDAKPISSGAGETDESTHIDQSATNTNPMYAVESPTSASLGDAANASFGAHGHHFTKAGKPAHLDASLHDTPRAPGAKKDSRQVFETTALATKGVQAGTYYGSVRWGWHTDAAEKHTKIDLEKVSDGVPSSTFLKSAELWNASTSSGGTATVDLPVPDVKVTTGPVTVNPDRMTPSPAVTLPVGTRLQIVTPWRPPALNGTVKVVDGPLTGHSGLVDSAEWPLIVDERT